jgi:hypothetical protein
LPSLLSDAESNISIHSNEIEIFKCKNGVKNANLEELQASEQLFFDFSPQRLPMIAQLKNPAGSRPLFYQQTGEKIYK